MDTEGNIYCTAGVSHVVLKIDKDKNITIFCGTFSSAGNTDGTASEAKLFFPKSIVYDKRGLIFVSDFCNDSIRLLDMKGNTTTLCSLKDTPMSMEIDDGKSLFVTLGKTQTIKRIDIDWTWNKNNHSLFTKEAKDEIKTIMIMNLKGSDKKAKYPESLISVLPEDILFCEIFLFICQ
jgi:hypothetical protein